MNKSEKELNHSQHTSTTFLVADSGSTKTDWAIHTSENSVLEIKTSGINPARDSQDTVFHILTSELLPSCPADLEPAHVFFYGAGCIEPFSSVVRSSLTALFPQTGVHVESDLLGAARAVCGKESGIVCILGTGMNSGYFDGAHILANTPPLGYVLGDEGSGAYLGKRLLNSLYKGIFEPSLLEVFERETGLDKTAILQRVYREPLPNTFLAQQTHFIHAHRHHPQIRQMLIDAFSAFFDRNIDPYQKQSLPVHFVGSIAHFFQEELSYTARLKGYSIGRILPRPIRGLVDYHLDVL